MPGELAVSPACFRPVFLASYVSGLFERLVLNHLCFYLESQNLASLAQASFRPSGSMIDQVLLLSQSLWEASSVGGSNRRVWPPLISLELLFGSGIQLSFTNYWFWFFRLALFGPICRRKNSGPLPWCSRPLVPSRTRCRGLLDPSGRSSATLRSGPWNGASQLLRKVWVFLLWCGLLSGFASAPARFDWHSSYICLRSRVPHCDLWPALSLSSRVHSPSCRVLLPFRGTPLHGLCLLGFTLKSPSSNCAKLLSNPSFHVPLQGSPIPFRSPPPPLPHPLQPLLYFFFITLITMLWMLLETCVAANKPCIGFLKSHFSLLLSGQCEVL